MACKGCCQPRKVSLPPLNPYGHWALLGHLVPCPVSTSSLGEGSSLGEVQGEVFSFNQGIRKKTERVLGDRKPCGDEE